MKVSTETVLLLAAGGAVAYFVLRPRSAKATAPAAPVAPAPLAPAAPKKRRSFWSKLGRALDPTMPGSIGSQVLGAVSPQAASAAQSLGR